MKKIIISAFLMLVCTLFFVSCDGGEKKEDIPGEISKLDISTPDNTAEVKWPAVENVDGYEVQLNEQTPLSVTVNSHTFTDLEYNTTYNVKVRTNRKGKHGNWKSASFAIGPKPHSTSWLGKWKSNSISISITSNGQPLEGYLPGIGSDKPVNIDIEKYKNNPGFVVVSFEGLQEYLPIEIPFNNLRFSASVSGLSAAMKVKPHLIKFDPVLTIDRVPELKDYMESLGLTQFDNMEIYSLNVELQDSSITGVFKDSSQQGCVFKFTGTAKFTVDANLDILLLGIINARLGDNPFTVTMNCDKVN